MGEDDIRGKNLPPKEEDFASMLQESFDKEDNKSDIINGVIVSIEKEYVLVDIGKKVEGRLNISELSKDSSNLGYKAGDSIRVIISGNRNGVPFISYKRALKKEALEGFCKNFDDSKIDDYIVEGKVTSKNRKGFLVEDDNGVEFFMPNSQAFFNKNNFKNAVGIEVKAKILAVNKETNFVLISRKKFILDYRRERELAFDAIINIKDNIKGVVNNVSDYGLFVDINGFTGLVRYDEIRHIGPVNPLALYKKGDEVDVKVIGHDKERWHIYMSIKATKKDPWVEVAEKFNIGDVIRTTVINIKNYGAFLDIGNDAEAFLHVSEISWDKSIKDPEEYISIGQEIDVKIIEMDIKNKRLRVSLKDLVKKPFEEFLEKYSIGDVIRGKVEFINNFGAFIEVDNIRGFLSNKEAFWEISRKCKDEFKVGDELNVELARIDKEREKIYLSSKHLSESPVEIFAKTHKVGDVVKGVVKSIKDFGIFVDIGAKVDAFIKRGDLLSDDIKDGDSIEASIISINSKENKIWISTKRLDRDRQRDFLKNMKSDSKITLGDIINKS